MSGEKTVTAAINRKRHQEMFCPMQMERDVVRKRELACTSQRNKTEDIGHHTRLFSLRCSTIALFVSWHDHADTR